MTRIASSWNYHKKCFDDKWLDGLLGWWVGSLVGWLVKGWNSIVIKRTKPVSPLSYPPPSCNLIVDNQTFLLFLSKIMKLYHF